MAVSTHTFQAPKGTRDFYPHDLAVRRYIESVWREVSINHGFDEIDGPRYEHLDLYTAKSGPGIVSELFSFRRDKGDTDYALRPEFTPTLARMYAAQASSLPKPTKWFSIGPYFRAESPQRGRLREHVQWNADYIGVPEGGTYEADTDVAIIGVVVDVLRRFGLGPSQVRVKLGHRKSIVERLLGFGVPDDQIIASLNLLDSRPKISEERYGASAEKLGWPTDAIEWYHPSRRVVVRLDGNVDLLDLPKAERDSIKNQRKLRGDLSGELIRSGLGEWCEFDSMVVRGLAYYTGTVFEVHEASGNERAIAGGGRYDHLVELFGGPPTRAVGIAMGDVVLRLVLEDHGLLQPAERYMAAPDVFVINARDEDLAANLVPLVSKLRGEGLHVRHSYKSTRNVGKLLSEANKARARFGVILGKELDEGNIVLKDLQRGEQEEVARDTLIDVLRKKLTPREGG